MQRRMADWGLNTAMAPAVPKEGVREGEMLAKNFPAGAVYVPPM